MKKYLFRFKYLFSAVVIFIVLAAAMDVIMAIIFKEIIDTATMKDMDKFKFIMMITVIYLIFFFGVSYIKRMLSSKYIVKTMSYLKTDLFNSTMNKSYSSFHSKKNGEYISIFSNDSKIIENDYFKSIFDIISNVVLFVLSVVIILKLSPILALGVSLTTILFIIVSQVFNPKLIKLKKRYSDNLGGFTIKIKELLSGFEVIKSYNIESEAKNQFSKETENLYKSRFIYERFFYLVDNISYFFIFLIFFTIIGAGAYLSIIDKISIGTVIAVIQLMNNILNPVEGISNSIRQIKSVDAIKEKFESLKPAGIRDKGIDKNNFNELIEFKDVDFGYDDKSKILKKVSFEIKKGEKIALVGSSGSGKSTILKVLLKYYKNYNGDILIDGVNLKDISSESLYKQISMIHQDVVMFDASLKDNVTLFQNYEENIFNKAVEDAGLESLIETLDEKYDTAIIENGRNLSGGEKQRISIARALMRGTPILLLDEITSALDNKTSFEIESALLDMKELTVLTVTHKLSEDTLKRYDKIIFINNGDIKEIGDFDQLIENKRYFYSMYFVDKMSEVEKEISAL